MSAVTPTPTLVEQLAALRRRAEKGRENAAWLSANWQGQLDALKALEGGYGSLCAARDAAVYPQSPQQTHSATQEPKDSLSASRATLAEGVKPSAALNVPQPHATQGIQLASDDIAHIEVKAIERLDSHAITVVDLDSQHAVTANGKDSATQTSTDAHLNDSLAPCGAATHCDRHTGSPARADAAPSQPTTNGLAASQPPAALHRLNRLADLCGRTVAALLPYPVGHVRCDVLIVTTDGGWLPLLAQDSGTAFEPLPHIAEAPPSAHPITHYATTTELLQAGVPMAALKAHLAAHRPQALAASATLHSGAPT